MTIQEQGISLEDQLPLSETLRELFVGEFYHFLTEITFQTIQLRRYKGLESEKYYFLLFLLILDFMFELQLRGLDW
jgi:hypothetical protein